MAKERYLILCKDDPNGHLWRVFDILPEKHTGAEPWYAYIRSLGKHPGLILTTARDWINTYVEHA